MERAAWGDEVAFDGIEQPGRAGERFLDRQFDLGMWQAGDVGELPGDFGREGEGVRSPVLPCGCEPIRQGNGKSSPVKQAR